GRGGTRRNNHHSTGRLNSPSSTSGWANPRGRPAITRRSTLSSPLPCGERSARGARRVRGHRSSEGAAPPHPNPLPTGEREPTACAARNSRGAPVEIGVAQVDAGAARPGAHAGVQREQEFARRAVGAVDDEAPAEAIRFGADFGAVAF